MALFLKTEQCRACPFRPKALPGWLGDYTPEEVIDCIRHEVPFICHTEVEEGPGYDHPDWEEWAAENANHCVGALIMARRMAKMPRGQEHAAAVKRVDTSVPILFPPQAFIDYHNAGIQKRMAKDEAPDPLKPSLKLLAALGSLIVHHEELQASGGHPFDQSEIDKLSRDPEVVEWFAQMNKQALLPLKRNNDTVTPLDTPAKSKPATRRKTSGKRAKSPTTKGARRRSS